METTLVTITKLTTCCRGDFEGCLAPYYPNRTRIPIGSKALKVEQDSAKGFATSFYCRNCMIMILENIKKCLEEYE